MNNPVPIKFFKNLMKIPMLIVLLATIALFGFSSIAAPAEVNRYAIVTGIGIDGGESENEKYNISLLVFMPTPQQDFTENYTTVNAEGESIAQALSVLSLKLGRDIGLSHIKFIVVNFDLLSENVSDLLDYLARNINLSASAKLIVTENTAKEFIEAAQNLDSKTSTQVSELVSNNKATLRAVDSSIETFFKNMYGPTQVGVISMMSIEEEENKAQQAAVTDDAQSSSSQGGGESKQSSAKEIENKGGIVAIKNSKIHAKISDEDCENLKLLRGDFKNGSIRVENVSDNKLQDANMVFDIYGVKSNFKVRYENMQPVVYIDMKLIVRLCELDNNTDPPKENVELFILSQEAQHAFEMKVKQKVSDAIMLMRDNQMDLADFYTSLYNANKSKFLKFLKTLEDENDYLNYTVFKFALKLETK